MHSTPVAGPGFDRDGTLVGGRSGAHHGALPPLDPTRSPADAPLPPPDPPHRVPPAPDRRGRASARAGCDAMNARRSTRPHADDHDPWYARYVSLVPDGDIVATLARQGAETRQLLATAPEPLASHRYAPGKWTLAESIAHVVDVERVFGHRLLWIARGAGVALPSMDHEAWAAEGHAHARALSDHLSEWEAVRAGVVALIDGLAPDAWDRAGEAAGARVTVRALAWMIAGHELHHRALWTDAYGVGRG